MSRSLRIPGLIDLVRADTRSDIRGLANDSRLDRRFEARGPLINRILVERIGPVKRLKEDANLGIIGVPISLTFHQGVEWPSSVDVEVQLEYTVGDPGDIQLRTNSP